MEVANQRNVDFHAIELLANRRNGFCGFRRVDGNAHQLGAGTRQITHLDSGTDGICRIGIGHRLHDYRRITAHQHFARAIAHSSAAALTAAQWTGCDRVI